MKPKAAYSISELRRNAGHFLIGKVGTASLTFLIFVLLAHSLRLNSYGAYATLLAMVELCIALSTLGLDWATSRYLPEYRLYANQMEIGRFLRMVCMPRIFTLFGLAALVLLNQNLLAGWLHLENYLPALNLYCGVLVVEGIGRIIRDSILGELMQQKLAQASLILRNLLLLLTLVWLKFTVWQNVPADYIRLHDVAVAEFFTALIGLALAAYFLRRHMRSLPATVDRKEDWHPVDRKRVWHTAKHMYASYLLTLSYGAQVLTFIINSMLGLQSTAIFGFARNLMDLLRRYLPSEIFMSLIRPKFVATYSESGGDVTALRDNALLAWKISLFVLTPGILFFAAYGKEFIEMVSNGKFTAHSLLVFCMLLALIPASQRRILEMIATILHHPDLCSRASATGLIMLPLAFALIWVGLDLWAIVITLFLGESLFNAILITMLKQRGFPYQVPVRSLFMMFISGVLCWVTLYLIGLRPGGWLALGLALMLSTVLFLFVAYLLKPFSTSERNSLNMLASRPLFIW